MRFLIRLLGALWLATLVVSAAFAWHEVTQERRRLVDDLQRRAVLAADAVREASERLVARGARTGYERVFIRFSRPDRAIAIYDAFGSVIDATASVKSLLGPITPLVTDTIQRNAPARSFFTVAGRKTLVYAVPLQQDERVVGAAVVLLDAQVLELSEWDLWRRTAVRLGVLMLLLTGITLLVVRWSVTRPMARIAEWTRHLKSGQPLAPPPEADAGLFGSLATEVTGLARTLARARVSAAEEARLRLTGESLWTEERLKQFVEIRFGERPIFIVSNREPVSHVREGRIIVEQQPASGLVTALEPIMLACGGVWVAHGSGSADREVTDGRDRVAVPPGHEEYTLRRLWLTEEEENGYYYGFANEGLWPLCHVAHVRPVFRENDWACYRKVNQRFADAVVAEARSEDPIVLVQDYHFALLPALIRKRLPRATILTFWHIPWPNPESFGICPWRREILQGMLGSTILGFHTRYHCKNFMETVDRYLEARIEHEHSTISFQEDTTLVEAYPISIEWPSEEVVASWASVEDCRSKLHARLGLEGDYKVALGVDRFDYTKGILERLHAVERMLEKEPQWIGRFSFVQVAAPSRSSLEEYKAFQDRIHNVTSRINERFGRAGYLPVHLLAQHFPHEAVTELYRAADACVVTSLHDGMNLVCKEFVAARDDNQGVLILSRFAGAAREMPEALIVNPYHVEETADALLRAITMPPAEQRERMASLRMTVREFNVYRWAGRMLADAGRTRLRERIEARVQRHQVKADEASVHA